MGADQSTIPEQPPLYPQPIPICATEPRFCLPHNVELHLREKYSSMSGGDFKIMDADHNDIIYFRSEGRVFSLSSRKILRDNAGALILERYSNKIHIFGGEESRPKTCRFKIRQPSYMRDAEVSTIFPDALNCGIQRHLVLKCSRRSKITSICLVEPNEGNCVPLARIIRPLIRHCGNDFIMEVAANVDVAICVMMCIELLARQGRR